MKCRTQINNTISKNSYTISKVLTFHGVEQGAENEWAHWSFISILMMDIIKDKDPGCSIHLPRRNKKIENSHVRICR